AETEIGSCTVAFWLPIDVRLRHTSGGPRPSVPRQLDYAPRANCASGETVPCRGQEPSVAIARLRLRPGYRGRRLADSSNCPDDIPAATCARRWRTRLWHRRPRHKGPRG